MKLTQEEIKQIIPHRDPMLLVSTVEEMVPGESIVTTFWVDPQREIFKGHFPAEPVLPGVYSVECMAPPSVSRRTISPATGVMRFLRKILPGDTLEIHAKMASERREKAIATCTAEIYCRGELAATGDVTLAMR